MCRQNRLHSKAVARGAGATLSRGYEQRGLPLTEGGLRYTIHPVTGQLLTSEVQFVSQDMAAASHRPYREDRGIIKACHYSHQPDFCNLTALLCLLMTLRGYKWHQGMSLLQPACFL